MPRGWFRQLIVISTLLALVACSVPRTRDPGYHHVRAGDTLFSIAFDYGLDYRDIARWNGIGPPYRIYAGQRLSLIPPDKQRHQPLAYYSKPVEDKSVGAWRPDQPRHGRAPPSPREPSPAKKPAEKPVVVAKNHPAKPLPKPRSDPSRWAWPAAGKVVTRFSPSKGKKGIDIRGNVGDPVRATAGGEVVYSGKGLIGYGNLIIIKHSDAYLSAYGHNRKLLVKEGEQVKAGQKIAEMGQRPKTGSILHFEIRKNGRPVDPIRYLPNQR